MPLESGKSQAVTGANDGDHELDSVGRLHLERVPISKAAINEYKGSEIPGYQKLGLQPDKLYRLLRDPEELAKAADTFNGIQLLIKHTPVSAGDHKPYDIAGAIGTRAEFEKPYLYNDVSVWTQYAIDGIEDETRRELSSSYEYDPDMTPGTYEGQPYDGVMRNLRGNHVSLVIKGRAGPDVAIDEDTIGAGMFALDEVKHDPNNGQFTSGGGGSGGGEKKKVSVSDLKSKLESMPHAKLMASLKNPNVDPKIKKHIERELDSRADRGTMKGFGEDRAPTPGASDSTPLNKETPVSKKTAVPSRTAIRLQAALSALAMDEKLDLSGALKGVTAKNLGARKPALTKALRVAFDELGQTGATPDDVIMKVLDMVEGQTKAEPVEADEAPAAATDPNAGAPAGGKLDKAKLCEWLKSKGMGDDDMSELDGMLGDPAEDEDETEEEKAARLAKEKAAKDEKDKEPMVSKAAMDQALEATAKTVEQRVLSTSREIASALSYVRPWVGDLANDEGITGPADVYRKALVSLNVQGADKLHADALRPVLEAQTKAGARPRADVAVAMDSAAEKSLAERFPHAARISNLG